MTKIYAVDAATGTEVLRDMTPDEESNYLQIKSDAEAAQTQKTKAEADKAVLLQKLGLTADDAKLLLS